MNETDLNHIEIMKLTPKQLKTLGEITNAPVGTPNTVRGWTWKCVEDFVRPYHTWHAGWVYGRFNSATLRALQRAGLIRIHRLGGAYIADELEMIS